MTRFITTILLLSLIPTAVSASLITFTTAESQFDAGVDNQGWWSNSASGSDTNTNYIAATFGSAEYRNFFTFDVSTLASASTSATLRIRRETGSGTNNATETIEFFDVTTAAATVNNNVGTNAAIFSDLGSGTSYGSFTIAGSGVSTEILEFDLNSSALSDIDSAGGFFTVGGAMTSATNGQYLFGYSGSYTAELVVNTCPEPSSLILVGLGIHLLLFRRRRSFRVSPGLTCK